MDFVLPALVVTDAMRHLLKHPLMDLGEKGRAEKDVQRTIAYVSVQEVANGKQNCSWAPEVWRAVCRRV